MPCMACGEPAEDCMCGGIFGDEYVDPDDIAFGFHIETIRDDEDYEEIT